VRSTARQRFWQLLAAASPTNGLKKFFLRRSGARIRDHVRIRRGSYVFGREIILGEGVVLEPNVHIVCGHLEMGTECKIDSETVVYGEGSLIMADGSYVGPRAWIDCSASVRLGRDTGVGPGSMIFTHGVWLSYLEGNPRKLEEVTLGDKVWVPAGVTVLPGVTVGDEAMIGAGSVVSKDVPPGTFAAGIPAKPVGEVAAMRAPSKPEDLDARAREMIEGFASHVFSARWQLRSGPPPCRYVFSTRGKPKTGVVYFPGILTQKDVAELQRDRRSFRRLILVALGGIDAGAHGMLQRTDWVCWFDFANARARRRWDRDTVVFRQYLGSHWGMRFRLVDGA